MRVLLGTIDRLCAWGAAAAAAVLVAMLALIFAEVLARRFFGTSLEFAWEYASYLLAAALLLGSGHVLRAGLHVRVQLALTALAASAGPRAARMLDLLATLVALAVSAFFAYALLRLALGAYASQTRSFLPSSTLMWPWQAAFALGGILLFLQVLARALRLVTGEEPEQAPTDAPVVRTE